MGSTISSKFKTQQIESVYTFKEKLGTGSFAVVRRATHIAKGEDYAVKIIQKTSLSPDELSTLNDEVEILQKISHQHIVKLYDIYETSSNLYMVMEILIGGELFESIVNRGSYSEKEAAIVTKQIASALLYLHNHGIVHRDLKPDNLYYNENPKNNPNALVKITNFGLAKFLGSDEKIGVMKTTCGTPAYVAPEILKSENYSDAVDMWSLGVILYILLCGYPPFYDESAAGLYAQIRSGGYVFQSPYWDHISMEAKNLIDNLLTVQPAKRIRPACLQDHAWFTKMESSSKVIQFGKQYITKMKMFNAKRKLKKGMTITTVGTSRFMGMFRAMAAAAKAPTRNNLGDTIRLKVIIDETREQLDVNANDAWNVAGLKLAIAEKSRSVPHTFEISFKGRVMCEDKTLASFHGLKDGVTITYSKTKS